MVDPGMGHGKEKGKSKSSNEGDGENIKVLVRIRPLLGRELGTASVAEVSQDRTSVAIETELHNVQARFDHVFPSDASQDDVYGQVRFAAESVVDGFNSTIFAYGQTGSGKSFTMFGPEDDLSIYGSGAPSQAMGVIPRAIREVLARASAVSDEKEANDDDDDDEEEVSIFCSFLQIYNDVPYDLLRDPFRQAPLEVHEHSASTRSSQQQPNKEIFLVGLSEFAVSTLDDCLALLEQGDEQRACRQTHMNDVSSRSHSIFQMVVERRKVASGKVVRSKLNLVDLAGSEKWGIMDTLEKGHVSELTNINTSLHTLGRCIAALTDPARPHVPFRDSKLTRILQDALGGNSRTCVIATLSPSAAFVEESISTLKFADRAKRVMQHARVVETREVSVELVERLEREVAHLRATLKSAGIPYSDSDSDSDRGKEPRRRGKQGQEQRQREGGREEEQGETTGFRLANDLFDARERVRALELENQALKAVAVAGVGVGAGAAVARASASAGGTPAAPRLEGVEKEHARLRKVVANLKTCATRFFSFEIEEEDFQAEFKRQMTLAGLGSASGGSRGSGGSRTSGSSGISGNATSQHRRLVTAQTAMVAVPGQAQHRGPASEVAERPADGRSEAQQLQHHGKVRSLAASLREKQKELAKHKKLQQYLALKAQREIDRIDQERRREEESSTQQRQRDSKFQKRASSVKQQLIDMKHKTKHKTKHKNKNGDVPSASASASAEVEPEAQGGGSPLPPLLQQSNK